MSTLFRKRSVKMLPKWTGDAVGRMHIHGISFQRLADKMGVNVKYLSSVMNGHRTPKGAQEKVMTALDELIREE